MNALQIPVKKTSIAQQASENGPWLLQCIPDFFWLFSILILYYIFSFSFLKSSVFLALALSYT